jgi:hypothetical protein
MNPVKPIEIAKDGAYEMVSAVDARLEAGKIDEAGWHREVEAFIAPAYLSAQTPWGQSGKSGGYEDWRYARQHLCEAFDRPGTFLDVGCASGFLMECVAAWCPLKIEPYGLDISSDLASLARRRLPYWADRIWVGNGLSWQGPMRFDYVRVGLEYVPAHRRRDLVAHLLSSVVAEDGRLIVGNVNEEVGVRETEEFLRSWGFRVTGGTERAHRDSRLAYRSVWVDGNER